MPFNFKPPKNIIWILAIAAVVGLYFLLTKKPAQNNATVLNMPAGFKISIFAENLGSPGTITFDPSGNLTVSDYKSGEVFLLENNGKAGNKKVLLTGLKQPYGLAFYTDPKSKTSYLYVAETNRVERYVYDEAKAEIKDKKGENIVTLPADGLNPLRNILFGPNLRTSPPLTGYLERETLSALKLYIGVGSSCDTCVEDSWKRGAVLESDAGGNYTAELAGGLRNPLFLTVQPQTDKVWVIDQNRNDLPNEINLLEADKKYGWPFCYGDKTRDRSFNPDPAKIGRKDIPQNCRDTESPVIEFPAGFTLAGLAFVPPTGKWPKEWQGNLLLAFDASPDGTGLKIVRCEIGTDGKPVGQASDFISGWNGSPSAGSGQEVNGRPVDLKFGPDGALYVTDDIAGAIYKIEYIKD